LFSRPCYFFAGDATTAQLPIDHRELNPKGLDLSDTALPFARRTFCASNSEPKGLPDGGDTPIG